MFCSLLLLALLGILSRFNFGRVKVWVGILIFVLLFLALLIFIVVVVVFLQCLACEEEDGPRNDPLPNVVTDLEIRSEQILGLWINVVVLVRHVWDRRRVEEVEEAVVLDSLGDGADVALRLVLLLLLDGLHRQVLALLPVNDASGALVYLGALEGEGVVLARLALHVVLLGEDGVGEKVVGVEVEVEGEGHGVLVEGDCDVVEALEDG